MKNVQYLPDVQYLPNVEYLQDVSYLPEVKGLQEVAPYNSALKAVLKQSKPYFRVIDDSYEKANSALDVLLGTSQRDALLKENDLLSWSRDIPGLRVLTGFLALVEDHYGRPFRELIQGESDLLDFGKEWLINTALEVSEDLDVLSNIIKSQHTAAGGEFGSLKTLSDSLGMNGRRVVYNFNTGNFVEDVALEMISDPITLLSMGASLAGNAGKLGTKGAALEGTKQLASNLSEQASKDYAKAVAKTVLKEGGNIWTDPYGKVLKNVARRSRKEIIEAGLEEVTEQIINKTLSSKYYKAFLQISKFKASVKEVDQFLANVAYAFTPVPAWRYVIKPGLKNAFKHVHDYLIDSLQKYNLEKHFVKNTGVYKEALATGFLQSDAIFETIFKENQPFLELLGIDEDKLQAYILNILQTLEQKGLNNTDLKEELINYLIEHNDQFRFSYLFKDPWLLQYIESESFEELIGAATVAPAAIMTAYKEWNKNYTKATINSMYKYIAAHKNNMVNIYEYINDNVLTFGGVKYGFENFDDFIDALVSSSRANTDYKLKIVSLLESLGISRTNAHNIDKILKSTNVKDKNKALQMLLEDVVNDKILTDLEYNKIITKVTNEIEDKTTKMINKALEAIPEIYKGRYQNIINNAFYTIEEAVVSIQNNEDVIHALQYMQNAVRLQDLPATEEAISIIEQALTEHLKLPDFINEETFRQYAPNIIPELKQFFKDTDRIIANLKTDKSLIYDIPSWYERLTVLKKEIDTVQKILGMYGDEYTIQARSTLNRIQKALVVFTEQEVKDPLINYLSTLDGLVTSQLSHIHKFDLIQQYTHATRDPQLKLFLEQLSDKNSVLRQRDIPKMIELFEEADLPTYAENLKKVVAQIDTTNNLLRLYATDIPTSFKLNKQTQTDIKNIIFDAIDNHKEYLIADIQSGVAVTQTYSRKIAGLQPRTLKQVLLDYIDNNIMNTEVLRKRIRIETAGLNEELVLQEIKEQAHNMLDTYINNQSLIGNYINNVSLSTLYDLSTIDAITYTEHLRNLIAQNVQLTPEKLNLFNYFRSEFFNFANNIKLGLKEAEKIDQKMHIPMHWYEAKAEFRNLVESYNLYSASIESGMYTTKYIINEAYDPIKERYVTFAELFNLNNTDIVGSNEEYKMLADRLWAYKDIVHEDFKYKENYLNKIRDCLITTYSQPRALFAPKNPSAYFRSLSAQELLTWETITKGNLSLNNKINYYTALTRFAQEVDINKLTISDTISQLEAMFRNTGFVDDESFANIPNIVGSTDALHYANRVVDAHLMTTLHSLDDLGKYKSDIVKGLKDNVADADYITNAIINIENNLLNSNNITDEVLYNKNITALAERSSARALNIAAMDAEELATYLSRLTDGWLVFRNENIIRVKHKDGSWSWKGIDNLFNFTEEQLKNAGIKIEHEIINNENWYNVRLVDNRVHNKLFKYKALGTSNEPLQKEITNLIDKYRSYLNMWESDDIPSNLLTTETLNRETCEAFLTAKASFYGDAETRKLYQKLTPLGNSSFFNKSYERINLSVIGGYDTYNLWNSMYSKTFIPRSLQLTRNTMSGLMNAVNRSNKIIKYLSLYFNKDYALDNPLLVKMFEDADDTQIKDFFNENKYKVAVLRTDKKGLPKVYNYIVDNRHSLDKAIAAGGILVPRETFNAMRQIINNRQMTNGLLDVYRRIVPSTYKSMYLYTAGFPFRNFLDSMIYKNANELGGITELPKVFKYEREASKALSLHDKIQKEVFELTEMQTFNKESLLKVLEKHTAEEAEIYFLTDIFIESEASGSFSKTMADWLEEYNKLNTDDIRALWERFYEDKVLYGKQPWNPLYRLRELNDHIEQTARFGLFLASVDSGLTVDDAIERVIKTHFNYASGGDMMDLCEQIFWFSTFPINNFNYYIEGGLTRSPTMLKFLMDTQTASWNNGEYTYEELKKTNFLAYHAMTGNIRIGNWIVKISPSVFDFLGLVADPIGNIKDRLNPFISVITEEPEDIIQELSPIQTQTRLWDWFDIYSGMMKQLTQNPVPSILSRINKYDWDRTLGRWRTRITKKPKWTHYPKVKIPRAQRMYARKYYVRRFYPNLRHNNRTYFYHRPQRFYRIGPRNKKVSYVETYDNKKRTL